MDSNTRIRGMYPIRFVFLRTVNDASPGMWRAGGAAWVSKATAVSPAGGATDREILRGRESAFEEGTKTEGSRGRQQSARQIPLGLRSPRLLRMGAEP